MDLNYLRETNNETFLPLFNDCHRYLVLCGGAGSGKSIFAGRKIIERAIQEPGHRILCCRKTARSLRYSVYSQLGSQLRKYHPNIKFKAKTTEPMSINLDNGSEFIFCGLDDVEKLKSIYNVTSVWIEEASEITQRDFQQLDIRLRGYTKYYKQIIITFNPVSTLHWLKKRFFDKPDPRALTHRSTYKDNRFLDKDAIETLERFREIDEYYYRVYCLGQWGVIGRSVFDRMALTAIIERDRRPVFTGYFDIKKENDMISSFSLIEERRGMIKIYEQPKKGEDYVIGADTAGTGGDYFVCQVVSVQTGRQVAILRVAEIAEDIFAASLYCLGIYYNEALIAVETNFSTYPSLELSRLCYPNQYVRETVDRFTGEPGTAFGFRTDSLTRPVIISGFIKSFREHPETICDVDTAEEMLSFVRNENLRPEAEIGAHDDCVIAFAIAEFVRQSLSSFVVSAPDFTGWSRDMIEDYERASDQEKEIIIKRRKQ